MIDRSDRRQTAIVCPTSAMKFAALLACLAAGALAARADTCAQCHVKEARSHASTGMARTLAVGAQAEILRANPALNFRDGAYSYTIREGIYAVTDGKQTISAPVAWAFGQGAAGQTYVFERNGVWFESRVSFYADIQGLALTMGARNMAPRNLDEAAGRQMTARDAAACFGCHSWGAVRESKLQVESIAPG